MPAMRRRRLAPLFCVLALVAAGCGGSDSKDDYVKEFNQVGATLEKTLSDIGSQLSATTDTKKIAGSIENGAKALDSAAKDLDAIDPPSDAEDAHSKIIAGIRDLAGTFRKSAAQAKAGDLRKMAATLSGLNSSAGAKKIQDAQSELKDKGYKVRGRKRGWAVQDSNLRPLACKASALTN